MTSSLPTFESSRLSLRPFQESDHENVFLGLSHPEVIRYYGVSFATLEATEEQMQWFIDLESKGTGCWWAICLKEDGTFLGGGGLNNWDRNFKKAEIGFWLLPEHWAKGYMTEAMPLISNHAYDNLGIHRIEGYVESENIACKKGLLKLGYQFEGTMRDCEVKDRRFINIDVYSKLATD